jgi:hypothetical protein
MTDTDFGELAENVYSKVSSELALSAPELGQAVHDAAGDFRAAFTDQIAVGRKLEGDVAELRKKRDLLPAAGYRRLRGEAISAAAQFSAQADKSAAAAIESLRERLTDAAQPRLDPAREGLARQETTLALGEAKGDHAAGRAITIAQSGSREAVAALNSPFGETLLQSHGVSGRTLTETRAAIRKLAARMALEKSANVEEILAAKVLERVDSLGAVRGAASSYVIGAIEKARR